MLVAGLVLSEGTALLRTPLLYDANPDLGREDPPAVAGMAGGYLLLALGLVLTSLAAIVTVLRARDRVTGAMTAMGFGVLAWAGFLIVSAIAAVNAFLPNLLWAFGRGAFPADAATEWHILFHNLHYLPLMATVLTWYALTQETTGTTSAFGSSFSKVVFASYLVFVPPTSLYHMFLEPNLAESVRVTGSLLSLFVSVPTLTAFLVIVSSLELATRAKGAPAGLFGWIGRLPWGNPAFSAMGVAIVSTLLGLVFAFVLIQEKFAPLISDTVFVPGYFHFFAVGAVTETFLAGFLVIIPALTGRAVWRPRLMAAMPWLVLAGLVIFGACGMLAGLQGVPRRTFNIAYDGAAPAGWHALMVGLCRRRDGVRQRAGHRGVRGPAHAGRRQAGRAGGGDGAAPGRCAGGCRVDRADRGGSARRADDGRHDRHVRSDAFAADRRGRRPCGTLAPRYRGANSKGDRREVAIHPARGGACARRGPGVGRAGRRLSFLPGTRDARICPGLGGGGHRVSGARDTAAALALGRAWSRPREVGEAVGEAQAASAGFSARSATKAAPIAVIRPSQGSSGAIAQASAATGG